MLLTWTHPSAFTRLLGRSTRDRVAKPPTIWLGALFVSALSSLPTQLTAETITTPSSHIQTHKTLSIKERLEQTESALAITKDVDTAHTLEQKSESLRFATLTGSTRFLLSESDIQISQQNTEEAYKALSSALTLQPNNALLRRKRASLRLLCNDPIGSVQDLQQALNYDERDPQSWSLLAHSQDILHHPQEALSSLQEALHYDPYLPDHTHYLKQLELNAHGHPD